MHHPWLIQVSEGQQVRISLLDFAGGSGQRHGGTPCDVYGYISESSTGTNQSICGGVTSETELFVSTSTRVQIQMQARGGGAQFLLKYDGISVTAIILQKAIAYLALFVLTDVLLLG